jgi:Tol biopolymer transport system component
MTMSLSVGSPLSAYEIVAQLGAGGMGEVYRAKDTKLGRDVALKILPASFTNDPERVARFRREAQVLASLNHPHIAQIHGLEEANGTQFLVLELVDGESLDKRIARGPIPVDEALGIAKQIAEALEAAHEKGIIHRDLKPANIALTKGGQVKVLDFGLAKAVEATGVADSMNSPTITSPAMMTGVGMILGTAAYMAPEQAKGRPADKRSDVWAFGCVLYEMLTGRRAFEGEDVGDTLASVLKVEPDLNALPATVPPTICTLVRRCLAKDRTQRIADISTASFILAEPVVTGVPAATPKRLGSTVPARLVLTAATALVTGAGLTALVSWRLSGDAPSSVVRFELTAPAGGQFPGQNNVPRFDVSPDGKAIVFEASSGLGKPFQLWIRRLDSTDAQPLAPTASEANALEQPFWSPDSRYVGFLDGPANKLKIIDLQGGSVQTVADVDLTFLAPGAGTGATWGSNGVILIGSGTGGPLRRVSANGGVLVPVTTLDNSRQESAHLWPQFLPDGRHFLFQVQTSTGGARTITVGSLDAPDRKAVVQSDYMAKFAPPNWLFYVRGEALVAQTLDLKTFTLTGEPVLIAPSVRGATNGRAAFSVSRTGVLVYAGGAATLGTRRLVWLDRTGKRSEPFSAPLDASTIRLSPDGRRVAFFEATRDAASDIWVYDIERDLKTRLTTDPAPDDDPVWSPDGSRLIFHSTRNEKEQLYEKPSNGAVAEQLRLEAEPGTSLIPLDWSLDRRFLIFAKAQGRSAVHDLWVLPLSGDPKPIPYLTTSFDKPEASLSPDARWLAYTSKESGTYQVIVQPFPEASAGKWQISTEGGVHPRWRRDGRELYYLDARNQIVAIPVQAGLRFEMGKATPLFVATWLSGGGGGIPRFPYEPSADGRQFLTSIPVGVSDPYAAPLTVVLNWQAALVGRENR